MSNSESIKDARKEKKEIKGAKDNKIITIQSYATSGKTLRLRVTPK